jgi:hypothetical protein
LFLPAKIAKATPPTAEAKGSFPIRQEQLAAKYDTSQQGFYYL